MVLSLSIMARFFYHFQGNIKNINSTNSYTFEICHKNETLAYSDGSKFQKNYKGLIGISLKFENSNPNKTCHTEGIVEFLHHNC